MSYTADTAHGCLWQGGVEKTSAFVEKRFQGSVPGSATLNNNP